MSNLDELSSVGELVGSPRNSVTILTMWHMLRLDCFLEEKYRKTGVYEAGFTLVYVETHYKTSFVRGYDISHLRVVEYCNQFDPWHIPFLVGFQDLKKHTQFRDFEPKNMGLSDELKGMFQVK